MIVIEKIDNKNRYSCNSCTEQSADIKITTGNSDENGNFYGMCMYMEFCEKCAISLANGIHYCLQNLIVKTGFNNMEINHMKNKNENLYPRINVFIEICPYCMEETEYIINNIGTDNKIKCSKCGKRIRPCDLCRDHFDCGEKELCDKKIQRAVFLEKYYIGGLKNDI